MLILFEIKKYDSVFFEIHTFSVKIDLCYDHLDWYGKRERQWWFGRVDNFSAVIVVFLWVG